MVVPLTASARRHSRCHDDQRNELAPGIVALIPNDEDHAVLTVRLNREWIVLDNRMLRMLRDKELARYRPTFVIDADGVLVLDVKNERFAGK